jgi:hypothetical protein
MAQRILDASPPVIHVVPLTATIRRIHVGVEALAQIRETIAVLPDLP